MRRRAGCIAVYTSKFRDSQRCAHDTGHLDTVIASSPCLKGIIKASAHFMQKIGSFGDKIRITVGQFIDKILPARPDFDKRTAQIPCIIQIFDHSGSKHRGRIYMKLVTVSESSSERTDMAERQFDTFFVWSAVKMNVIWIVHFIAQKIFNRNDLCIFFLIVIIAAA